MSIHNQFNHHNRLKCINRQNPLSKKAQVVAAVKKLQDKLRELSG